MIQQRSGIVAALGIGSLMALAGIHTIGCGSGLPKDASAVTQKLVERGPALGYAAAVQALSWFDGRLVAEHEAKHRQVLDNVKAVGKGLDAYKEEMDTWRAASGWTVRKDRVFRAHNALNIFREYLNGDIDEATARDHAMRGLKLLNELLEELESQGVEVPGSIKLAVEQAAALGGLL